MRAIGARRRRKKFFARLWWVGCLLAALLVAFTAYIYIAEQ